MTPPAPDLSAERALLAAGAATVVGIDEVGRGALAGPVTVGAVVIDADCGPAPAGLRDSKLLRAAARQRLIEPVCAWARGWAIGHSAPDEIDRLGIMAALRLAASRALAELTVPVDAILLDGSVDYLGEAAGCGVVTTRVRADRYCASVAAASVVAKVTRDRLMVERHRDFPQYGWDANKGYGTAAHAAALAAFGPCLLHRRSWSLPGVVRRDEAPGGQALGAQGQGRTGGVATATAGGGG